MKNRVEGYSNVFKDQNSGVITNNNNSDRERYRLAKDQARKNMESQDEIKDQARKNMESQDEIKDLKEELSDIKTLLKQLINNK